MDAKQFNEIVDALAAVTKLEGELTQKLSQMDSSGDPEKKAKIVNDLAIALGAAQRLRRARTEALSQLGVGDPPDTGSSTIGSPSTGSRGQ